MSAKGSELKRVRQSIKRQKKNKHYKSLLNSTVKKVFSINKKEDASTALKDATKIIDKIASKGIIHKKKASNKKSKLSKYVNNL